MEQESRQPRCIDRIARTICVVAAIAFALLSYLAFATEARLVLRWSLLSMSIAFVLLATVAPRNVRLAVVSWLPWL